jgi:UDP-glucuronate decarboxylase
MVRFLLGLVFLICYLQGEKRALVTGGAGFLGSHLCEKLLDSGIEVICVDNLSSGKKENIEHLLKNPRFFFLEHDIVQPLDSGLELDFIFNLACLASPPVYQKDPLQTFRTSIWGAYNLLELAKKTGAKILQASTSEVYGEPLIHPQNESYWGNVNPIGIRSCYDEGKRAAESLFFNYHRLFKIPVKVARIFNTYGPRLDPLDGRVVSNFFSQAMQNLPLTIYGDGFQTRSFCYVEDTIEGLVQLMFTDNTITGPINIGNPEEITILELAKKIKEVSHSVSQILLLPLPCDDPSKRKPDISKAKTLLNWSPRYALDEGLKKTYLYLKTKQ